MIFRNRTASDRNNKNRLSRNQKRNQLTRRTMTMESLEDRRLLAVDRFALVLNGFGGADTPPRVIDELRSLDYEVLIGDWNSIDRNGLNTEPGGDDLAVSPQYTSISTPEIPLDFGVAGDFSLPAQSIEIPTALEFGFVDLGDPDSSQQLIADTVDAIATRGLDNEDRIVLIGHSLGGDSALRIAEAIDEELGVEIDLLALLDPVGFLDGLPDSIPIPGFGTPAASFDFGVFGSFEIPATGLTIDIPQNSAGETPGVFFGSSLVDEPIPNNVRYLFNRWQSNNPFPVDFLASKGGVLPRTFGGGRDSVQTDFGVADEAEQDEKNAYYSPLGSGLDLDLLALLAPENIDFNPFEFGDIEVGGVELASGVPIGFNSNFLKSNAQLHHDFPRNEAVQDDLIKILTELETIDIRIAEPDELENNDELIEATVVGSPPTSTLRGLTIHEGDKGIDEDYFQVTAHQTGKLIVNAFFRDCAELQLGNLDLEIYDSEGQLIAVSDSEDSDDEQLVIPVVSQEQYFIRIFSENEMQNFYDLEIENFAAPIPATAFLASASDSGRHDRDFVTNDSSPTILTQVDLHWFEQMGIELDEAPGVFVDVFVTGVNTEWTTSGEATWIEDTSLWKYSVSDFSPLDDDEYLVNAVVRVVDARGAEGRTVFSEPTRFTLDTLAPAPPTFILDPSLTDSGVEGQSGTIVDRVTHETSPGFIGNAEANSIVTLTTLPGDRFVNHGSTVATPTDGNVAYPNGFWSHTVAFDLNDPTYYPLDGLRKMAAEAEDLAGNVSEPGTLDIFIDTQGPQVTDVRITGEPDFNLFAVEPGKGPTPLVHSITVSIQDLAARDAAFLYDALQADAAGNPAGNPGHYQVVGDHNGLIAIDSVVFAAGPGVADEAAMGTLTLHFAQPLPDDRFTLTISDAIVDPAGNALDGDSNAAEPNEGPTYPTGDGQPGGDFVARFTVDSRAEIGTWANGIVYVDTNGNNIFDPESQFSDFTNEDIVYKLGTQLDQVIAGNFVAGAADVADGYDKLASYGYVAGAFRWLIDTNNNGVPDVVVADPAQINGLPVAGNFDGLDGNGDEIGLKSGTTWHLDTDHDFLVDTTLDGDMIGKPFVGDFDGDGIDDLGSWTDDTTLGGKFTIDLGADGIDGFADIDFAFGFPGVRELPFAADFNGDGLDDLGLWNPDGTGITPEEQSEWFILMSQPGAPAIDYISNFKGETTFSTTSSSGQVLAEEFIPVDPTKTYEFSAEGRSGDGAGGQYDPGNRQFFGFSSYDDNQRLIQPWHVLKVAEATDTTLAEPLNPGDTTIKLVDATGWSNGGAAHTRSIAWFASNGEFTPYTYTRDVAIDFADGMWDVGAVSGNEITLRVPWAGPAIEAGTAVRNAKSGPTYNYALASNETVPDDWTSYSATISGIGVGTSQFRPGTAYIKPVALPNRHGNNDNLISWRNVQVSMPPTFASLLDRITTDPDNPSENTIQFTPVPFGPDLYAKFGDSFALPVVGNFDPPIVSSSSGGNEPIQRISLTATNTANAFDANGDGNVTALDALLVINHLNRTQEATGEWVEIEQGSLQLLAGPQLDVNSDRIISAVDALQIINRLNELGSQAATSEPVDAQPLQLASASDVTFPREEAIEQTIESIASATKKAVAVDQRDDTQPLDLVLADWDTTSSSDRDEPEGSELTLALLAE